MALFSELQKRAHCCRYFKKLNSEKSWAARQSFNFQLLRDLKNLFFLKISKKLIFLLQYSTSKNNHQKINFSGPWSKEKQRQMKFLLKKALKNVCPF